MSHATLSKHTGHDGERSATFPSEPSLPQRSTSTLTRICDVIRPKSGGDLIGDQYLQGRKITQSYRYHCVGRGDLAIILQGAL